jgi:hypothetical protein
MTRVTVVGAVLIVALILIALIAIQALTEWNSSDRTKSD